MFKIFNRGRRPPPTRSKTVSADIPLLRWVGPILTVVALFMLVGAALAGKINLSVLDQFGSTDDEASALDWQPVRLDAAGEKSTDTIRIATFRVAAFTKADEIQPTQISILARIVSQFDVVALQGVSGTDAKQIQSLVDLMRVSGGRYTASTSEPVGRGGQSESYAFVWDESRIQLVPGSVGVVQDGADRMLFEPMYASFESRVGFTDGRRPFRFTLINAHSLPPDRNAALEVDVLDDVFVSVRNYGYEISGEEDCILLGDLGVGVNQLGQLSQIPGVRSIAGRVDSFQHIVLDPNYTAEFTGQSGMLDFRAQLKISTEEALSVSNELPLWAEFSANEVPAMAAGSASRSRMIR